MNFGRFYQDGRRDIAFSHLIFVEQVMSDALFKLAGELSLSAIRKKEGRHPQP